MRRLFVPLIACALILLFTAGCKKENDLYDKSDARLKFTADTVLFDTIFTKLDPNTYPKSINKQFIVRNPYNQPVRTDIMLAGGASSPFKLNVDGMPGTSFYDVEIRAKDSIYVFVELYALPNGGSGKLIINDSIQFNTNSNLQYVQLRAWGQDAHFYRDSVLDCGVTWSDISKPYVIYNSILVPPNCTFTINPGVHVYSAPGSFIYVQGTLRVLGTSGQPVIFEGDRLEKSYADQPGQWGGIWILRDSKDNLIRYAKIKNALVGITVDSLPVNSNPNLRMENTMVQTMTSIGLYGKTSRIYAENCLFANCGQLSFYGRYGGDFDFRHCTFGNYANFLPRDNPGFAISNTERDGSGNKIATFNLKFNLENCIVWGTQPDEELFFDIDDSKLISGVVGNNLFKTKKPEFVGVPTIIIENPRFKDPYKTDFSLDTLSPAKNKGVNIGIPIDILGKSRDIEPDLGAYERIE